MKRNHLITLTLAALLATASLTSAQTSPEALAAMKAKLAELKKEAAALEDKIAAAEAPPAGTVPAVIAALNAMPKNLWPGESDTEMKTAAREKWLTENIKPGVPYTLTGSIMVANSSTLYPAGKPAYEGLRVVLNCGRFLVWGQESDLKLIAVLENVKPEDTLDWPEKKTLTVVGTTKDTRTTNPVEVTFETAKMK